MHQLQVSAYWWNAKVYIRPTIFTTIAIALNGIVKVFTWRHWKNPNLGKLSSNKLLSVQFQCQTKLDVM